MTEQQLLLAQENLRPNDFRLRSSQIKLMDDVRPTVLENFDFKTEGYSRVRGLNKTAVQSMEGQDLFYYVFFTQLGVRAKPTDEAFDESFSGVDVMLEIHAEFDCEYISDVELPDEAIKEFGSRNVGFNVWPFWREYVLSTLTRVGIPRDLISVPLYMQQASKSKDQ